MDRKTQIANGKYFGKNTKRKPNGFQELMDKIERIWESAV